MNDCVLKVRELLTINKIKGPTMESTSFKNLVGTVFKTQVEDFIWEINLLSTRMSK